jgi:hypothetical protein
MRIKVFAKIVLEKKERQQIAANSPRTQEKKQESACKRVFSVFLGFSSF